MSKSGVVFVSFSFSRGGAAKAAQRFVDVVGQDVEVSCVSVEDGGKFGFFHLWHFVKRLISFALVYPYRSDLEAKVSANFFSFYPILKAFKNAKSEVFNIHWINNDSLSIFRFKEIPYASVITLHDEWFYCGLEHYLDYRTSFECSSYVKSVPIDIRMHRSIMHYFVWNVKRKALEGRKDLIVTCPSSWLAGRARRSHVLKDCDVRVLPNPVNVDVFSVVQEDVRLKYRKEIGVENRFLLVFGAVGGGSNPLKGYSELLDALEILSTRKGMKERIAIGLFGDVKKGVSAIFGFPVYEFGIVTSELEMAKLYATANVTVVPSRVESFGQVAAESLSCGTPVVSFNTSGLKDIVLDGRTGLLAEPFSPLSLADRIEELTLLPEDKYRSLCVSARRHVVNNFSFDVVKAQYRNIVDEQVKKRAEIV